MSNRSIDNAKLGLFVLAGALFLVFSLYMIGRNRNLFGASFTIHASFHNVNGLMTGNNVRYSGIDVGTVKRIRIVNDTSVHVTLLIDKSVREFIKKNAIASVGTDGLMGNKLININSSFEPAPPIQEGDTIRSQMPVETDEMLRTLNTTNENIAKITADLKKITQKINNSNSLWSLLSDTVITEDIRKAAFNIKLAGKNAATTGEELITIMRKVNHGDGLAGVLLTDTVMSQKLTLAVKDIQNVSEQTSRMAKELNTLIDDVKKGKGTAGVLLSDTTLEQRLHRTMINIEQGTYRFNEDMEALKHSFLLRGYFRKQEKKSSKDSSK